jgi:hypothetical protein
MVAHLLRNQLRLPLRVPSLPPRREEHLSQKGVKRFLDAVLLRPAPVLLVLERGEVPAEDKQEALCRVGFGGGGQEERGVLGPVGGELDGALRGEDEGRGGDVGEVTAEGGYGLWAWALADDHPCLSPVLTHVYKIG